MEEQLKNLLRRNRRVGSFAQADMVRAAGRVLFYLRVGPGVVRAERGGRDAGPGNAAPQRDQRHRGARRRRVPPAVAGPLRPARLAGRPAAAVPGRAQAAGGGPAPATREPVLWLAGKPKQERAEWRPTPLSEIAARLADTGAWGALAGRLRRPERTHAIFNTAKARTWDEALAAR